MNYVSSEVAVGFENAFEVAANNPENINNNGSFNWNFIDADLCIDGWMDILGDNLSFKFFYEMVKVVSEN